MAAKYFNYKAIILLLKSNYVVIKKEIYCYKIENRFRKNNIYKTIRNVRVLMQTIKITKINLNVKFTFKNYSL